MFIPSKESLSLSSLLQLTTASKHKVLLQGSFIYESFPSVHSSSHLFVLAIFSEPSDYVHCAESTLVVSLSLEEVVSPLVEEVSLSLFVDIKFNQVNVFVVLMGEVHSFSVPRSQIVSTRISQIF
jgi:hypothetical protein